MGTDGPSIDAEAERQEGGRGDGEIGGDKETGDVIRDAPEVVKKKRLELREFKKTKKKTSCVFG